MASDALVVSLLQLDAGVEKPLHVVPLFKTLDDLNGDAGTMEQLYSIHSNAIQLLILRIE